MKNDFGYITDLQYIAAKSSVKVEENSYFTLALHSFDDVKVDEMAQTYYARIAGQIDCKGCGNCCKGLVINVRQDEVDHLAALLEVSEADTMDGYVEETAAGGCCQSTIPCHFLHDNHCTIYEHRFTECKDFPNLHKPGFKARLHDTLIHYGRCPIIYNVVESMKTELGFRLPGTMDCRTGTS